MKLIAAIPLALLTSGCLMGGLPTYLTTAPGSELPAEGVDYCEKKDELDRCTKWRTGSGKIRPYDTPPAKP